RAAPVAARGQYCRRDDPTGGADGEQAMTDSAKVLVAGIDGVRWDVLPRAATPFLDAVAARGFAAPVTADAACPTCSAPCWATILPGTLPATHGIVGNVARPAAPPPPDALALARAAGRRTFAAA